MMKTMNRNAVQALILFFCASAAGINLAQATVLTPTELGYFNGNTRESVHAECKQIAIIPVATPAYPGVEFNASAKMEAAATRALQSAGFDVVSADLYNTAYEKIVHDAGGLYNPATGSKRTDVMNKAVDAALKALLSDPQVNCFANLHVAPAKASVANRYAYFDGVKEYSDGQANSAMSAFLLGSTGTGSIPAISIVLRIYNRSEKQLFGRFGGVQLTTYLDKQHGDNHGNYLFVPREALLQDDKRIERALTTATVPLRYSPGQIDAGSKDPAINTIELSPSDMPKPPPGSHQIDKPLLVPREQISVHRIALGTLATGGLVNSAEVAARYRAMVHERLTKLGWEVIDTDLLNAAFVQASNQAGGIYDPATGKTDPNRLKLVTQIALKSLSLPATPDAFVMISLVRSNATQVMGNVDWDGTQQSALTLGPATNGVGGTQDVHAGQGTIGAVSFSFTLRDASGTLLVDSHGGIQLLQKLSYQEKRESGRINYIQSYANLAAADLFNDPAKDTHAVDVALQPLLKTAPVSDQTASGK